MYSPENDKNKGYKNTQTSSFDFVGSQWQSFINKDKPIQGFDFGKPSAYKNTTGHELRSPDGTDQGGVTTTCRF